MHLCERAAVKFKIKFAVVERELVLLFFNLLHERADCGFLNLRHTVKVFRSLKEFKHSGSRSAAAVTEAVCRKSHVAGALVGVVADDSCEVFYVGDEVRAVEVGDDFGAVDSVPDECVGREVVEVVPAHLCGVEILYAGFLHDLRDSGIVTECIGEPE